jgi:hypothetical protein
MHILLMQDRRLSKLRHKKLPRLFPSENSLGYGFAPYSMA